MLTFLGLAATYAVAAYKPENPQYALLAFAALGIGAVVGALALGVGEFLSRPTVSGRIAHLLHRETYDRHAAGALLLLGLFLATFVMFAIHLIHAVRQGDTLSGWTAAVFAAIIFYPLIRHRIERGRWPG